MKRLAVFLALLVLSLGVVVPVSAQANPEQAAKIRKEKREKAATERQSKEDRLAKIKAEVDARKLVLAQEKCEARETKLKAAVPRLTNSATKLKTVIDTKYDKVQAFYEAGKLTVENYEELVADIELAKANAEASLEALGSYEIEIDCEQSGLGGQLDSFRTAVKETREDLKAYRKSLVELISSLNNKVKAAEAEEEAESETEETESTEETERTTTNEAE